MSENQKVALVSGASRGIGRAIAKTLGQQGYYVIGSATSETGADNITQALQSADINGHGVVLNIADQDRIDGVMEAIQSSVGTPAILINNAGITRDNIMLRMKESEWLARMKSRKRLRTCPKKELIGHGASTFNQKIYAAIFKKSLVL